MLNFLDQNQQNRHDPLLAILDKLGGWPARDGDKWNESKFNWITTIIHIQRIGYTTNYLLPIKLIVDPENNTKLNLKVCQKF